MIPLEPLDVPSCLWKYLGLAGSIQEFLRVPWSPWKTLGVIGRSLRVLGSLLDYLRVPESTQEPPRTHRDCLSFLGRISVVPRIPLEPLGVDRISLEPQGVYGSPLESLQVFFVIISGVPRIPMEPLGVPRSLFEVLKGPGEYLGVLRTHKDCLSYSWEDCRDSKDSF